MPPASSVGLYESTNILICLSLCLPSLRTSLPAGLPARPPYLCCHAPAGRTPVQAVPKLALGYDQDTGRWTAPLWLAGQTTQPTTPHVPDTQPLKPRGFSVSEYLSQPD